MLIYYAIFSHDIQYLLNKQTTTTALAVNPFITPETRVVVFVVVAISMSFKDQRKGNCSSNSQGLYQLVYGQVKIGQALWKTSLNTILSDKRYLCNHILYLFVCSIYIPAL